MDLAKGDEHCRWTVREGRQTPSSTHVSAHRRAGGHRRHRYAQLLYRPRPPAHQLGVLDVCRPLLLAGVPALEIRDIQVADARVSLRFEGRGDCVEATVLDRDGALEVAIDG